MEPGDQREAWEAWYSGQPRPWKGTADLGWVRFTPGEKVLDAGCGNGKTSETLMDFGCEVTGVDISGSAVAECGRRFGSRGRFVCGDVCCLPFENGTFDTVVSVHCLEHTTSENEPLALSEFRRVLVPGGRLVLQMFAFGDFRSEGRSEDVRNGILYRYHTEDSIRAALSGWNVSIIDTDESRTRFGTVRRRFHIVAETDRRCPVPKTASRICCSLSGNWTVLRQRRYCKI